MYDRHLLKCLLYSNFSLPRSPRKSGELDLHPRLMTAGEVRRAELDRKKQEKKKGYCELCSVKYDDIEKVRQQILGISHFSCGVVIL